MPASEKELMNCIKPVIHMGQIPASILHEWTHSLERNREIGEKMFILLIFSFTKAQMRKTSL